MGHPLKDYRSLGRSATRGKDLALLTSVFLLAWAGFAASAQAAAEAKERLCPDGHIVMSSKIDPGLSDSEKRLVCGDSNPQAANTDQLKFDNAWKTLPPSQARFNMRNFLQERGYFHPFFSETNGVIWVNPGAPTRVMGFELVDAPEGVDPGRRRKLIGETMTPGLLSSTEKWVESRVRSLGYPCPKLKTMGDPETGLVVVHVETGPLQNLHEIIEHDLPGIQPGVLRRYDAFELEQPYNEDLLVVSANRITSAGLFQNIRFTGSCGPNGAVARQNIVAGPPRLLQFGIGFDTEGLVRAKAAWANTRLGPMASSFNISAFASAKDQLLNFTLDWYFRSHPSRQSLKPLFQLTHENQIHYETLESRAQLGFSTSYDDEVLALRFLTGPTYDRVHTISGIGPVISDFISLETQVQARSHAFEFFQTNPRAGWQTSVTADFNSGEFGSSVSAQRLAWDGRALWNLRNYDPPLWVFAARFGAKTVVTGDGLAAIPPNFRQYLGGSVDLRGFGLEELPGPAGSLSSAFLSLEVRLVATLPLSIEPFVFFDIGALGAEPFSLDLPVYRSPGFGLRWLSPIGVIRTTLAHGMASGNDGHWQFYLSFGEEF